MQPPIAVAPAQDPIRITQEQERLFERHVDGVGCDSLKRGVDYLKSRESREIVSLKFKQYTGKYVYIGAIAGGITGAIIGGAVASPIGLLVPIPGSTIAATVIGGVEGAIIGGAAGAGLGLLLGCGVATNEVVVSKHYILWKAQAIGDNVFPIFRKYVEKDSDIRYRACPISLDIPDIPVKGKCQEVFDRATILHWIGNKKFEYERDHGVAVNDETFAVPCPVCKRALRKIDLEYRPKYARELLNLCKEKALELSKKQVRDQQDQKALQAEIEENRAAPGAVQILARREGEMKEREVHMGGLNAHHVSLSITSTSAYKVAARRLLDSFPDDADPEHMSASLSRVSEDFIVH